MLVMSVHYVLIFFCISLLLFFFVFFKQKTAYEMRISDWSSDVCSSDLAECLTDRLMAKANTKDRHLAGGLANEFEADVGALGIAGSGRNDDARRTDRKSVV